MSISVVSVRPYRRIIPVKKKYLTPIEICCILCQVKILYGVWTMDLDVYKLSMLLDFYGQLLTENQFTCLDLHCNQDLSMGEIAQELDISRQGVYDFIKKGRERLLEYEERLKLLERFDKNNRELKNIRALLSRQNVAEAMEKLDEVIKNGI